MDINCNYGITKTKSTTNSISIERNTIQPMDTIDADAQPTIPANQIWYTSSDGAVVTPYMSNVFGAEIVSNTYENGQGVITFDADVTSIGDWAFYNCSSLTSVTIPDSVTRIGSYAFSGCSSLKDVYCKPSTPPTGGSSMFYGNASGRKIYVPASDDDSIINAYTAATYWSDYAADIVEYDFSAEE